MMNMANYWDAKREGRAEGRNEGRSEGIEIGRQEGSIIGFITACREFDKKDTEIVKLIMERFSITKEEATDMVINDAYCLN